MALSGALSWVGFGDCFIMPLPAGRKKKERGSKNISLLNLSFASYSSKLANCAGALGKRFSKLGLVPVSHPVASLICTFAQKIVSG